MNINDINERLNIPTPLKMSNPISDMDIDKIKNILLIDDLVYQNEILFESTNSNTLAIKYNTKSDKKELEELLTNNFTSLERIGFVFNNALMNSKEFLNSELFFTPNDLELNKTKYSPNLQFVVGIVKKFNIKNLDYLVCNGLNYPDWTKYFEIVKKETGVIIGASNDLTGNLKYGGDWVMESTNENIKQIYWNENILNYTSTLVAGVISTSTIFSQSDVSNYTWPITIEGGTQANPVIITFGTDLTFNALAQYFIIGSEYIVIEGNNKTVTIDGINGWNGLIQNGLTSTNGYANITLQSINVDAINSSILEIDGGWITWSFFARGSMNNQIINCSSSGNISATASGGIAGSNIGRFNGEITLTNCYTSGEISGYYSGGIAGSNNGSDSGFSAFINCFTSGNINGNGAGGIVGYLNGNNSGEAIFTNCYSSGNITNVHSGGIAGRNVGNNNGIATFTNCYSLGNISGSESGGIVGSDAGFNSGSATFTNCYSSGDISGVNSGGIVGSDAGRSSGSITLTNCYTCGSTTGINAGDFFGSGSQNTTVNTSGHDDGTWIDSNALIYLTGTPVYDVSNNLINPIGDIWADIDTNSNNVPWIFSTLGYSPYTTKLNTTYTQRILQGGITNSALNPTTHTYTIVAINDELPSNYPEITINSSNGTISTSPTIQLGTYNIKIRQNSFYTMTNFVLTVIKPKPYSNTRTNCYYVKMRNDEIFSINLNKKYFQYAGMEKYIILKKPKHGYININSKNKLVYKPNTGYTGYDQFVLFCDNIEPNLSVKILYNMEII